LLAGSPGASQLASSGAQAATQAATQAASQTPTIPGLISNSPNVFSSAPNPITESMVNGMNFPLTPGGVQPVADPSYWDKFTKFTQQNPALTQMGFSTAKDVLTEEQPQMSPAPTIPVQARNQLRPYDPMSYMDPYKQTAVGGQPISLI
jgi:hypothetical protein